MHVRALIRAAVADKIAGLPTTGGNVHIGRSRVLTPAQLPALLIYTHDETSDRPIDGNPASLGRDLTLAIEGRVATVLPPDDLLDQIAFEVEGRMRDTNLNGLVFDTLLTHTQVEVAADGERQIGAIRLEYRVRYHDPAEDE